jgi:hypothetical protein
MVLPRYLFRRLILNCLVLICSYAPITRFPSNPGTPTGLPQRNEPLMELSNQKEYSHFRVHVLLHHDPCSGALFLLELFDGFPDSLWRHLSISLMSALNPGKRSVGTFLSSHCHARRRLKSFLRSLKLKQGSRENITANLPCTRNI